MVNSNYYVMDFVFIKNIDVQVVCLGNIIYVMIMYCCKLDCEEIKFVMVLGIVFMCFYQMERMFNIIWVLGKEIDVLQYFLDSWYVVVYYKGCFFKLWFYEGFCLFKFWDLEMQFQRILDDFFLFQFGEEKLVVFIVGGRVEWVQVCQVFFSFGKNKVVLEVIECVVFFVVLDEEFYCYDFEDEVSFSFYGKVLLYGNCYNRWFDKFFIFIFFKNGQLGFNVEYVWVDVFIIGYFWEFVLGIDSFYLGYMEIGYCLGKLNFVFLFFMWLQWDILKQCQVVIESFYQVVKVLVDDVELYCFQFLFFGKGFIKKCWISFDVFVQIVLQLVYFWDRGKFCLIYEVLMIRMFWEGWIEIVCFCISEFIVFVQVMVERFYVKVDL